MSLDVLVPPEWSHKDIGHAGEALNDIIFLDHVGKNLLHD